MTPRKLIKKERSSDGEENLPDKSHPTRLLRKREWDSAR